ncbi:hypothetical protein [Aquabacterium sp.]|uniref:hypothetical protein n=1 Tax=Aquabacterium sp. TaxID=1872578 RepID=UPI0035B20C36
MNASIFPPFFDQVPGIRLRDPLAAFLGAAEGGVLDYRYADAVRLAGHSCPTVASAYWLCARSLNALYPDAMPVRGRIEVALRDPIESGTMGVVAGVVGLITGASGSGGFKGIGGQFVRRDLLAFNEPIATELRFTRADTGATVCAQAHLKRVPADPRMAPLMQRCLHGEASADDHAEFADLWQGRVRRILIDHAFDDDVFEIDLV